MAHLPEDQTAIDHWSRAGTPAGRFGLRLRLHRKRFLWTVIVGGAGVMKRMLDLVAAASALILLMPVFAATALAIKHEDRGPLFFRQTRVGLRGRTFGMWKFRSMVPNAEKLKDQLLQQNEMQGGVTFKMKHDPRITRVGRFIRKFSIDELPQFWNVLCGDMSLVGPRPPVPREVALYAVDERQRLLAKPGLTCFWQVGGRSDIDFAGQVRLDVLYIQSTSFWLDVKLLLLTVPAVLLGKGSY
jgi:lipopolysaccharide/colanic/teichoic acid biosynthesis glycosyltransferase